MQPDVGPQVSWYPTLESYGGKGALSHNRERWFYCSLCKAVGPRDDAFVFVSQRQRKTCFAYLGMESEVSLVHCRPRKCRVALA